jgi:aspartyl-tRNA(Asn)/glutamyl-tRNA(Gln) amidotransferase subunit C
MKINIEIINHIAHLSRLKFDGDEKIAIQKDLENIISFMDKLNEIDTSNVEPLVFMSEEINVIRDDLALVSIDAKNALKNAPKKDSDYFRIPKVLDK